MAVAHYGVNARPHLNWHPECVAHGASSTVLYTEFVWQMLRQRPSNAKQGVTFFCVLSIGNPRRARSAAGPGSPTTPHDRPGRPAAESDPAREPTCHGRLIAGASTGQLAPGKIGTADHEPPRLSAPRGCAAPGMPS